MNLPPDHELGMTLALMAGIGVLIVLAVWLASTLPAV